MVCSQRPLRVLLASNMALQRTRALAFARVRSPLNARPLARFVVAFAIGPAMVSNLAAAAPTKTTAAPRADCAMVEAVLARDGHVKSARVTKSAGALFDRRALAFVKTRRYPVPKARTKVLYLSVAVCRHELR